MDKSKSRRIITIVLIIAGILGLASIAIAYYYFQIRDVTPDETSAAQGCGCYYVVDSSDQGVGMCANTEPTMAIEFRAGFVQSNGLCSVTCDGRHVGDIAGGNQDNIVSCPVSNFPVNPGCINVSIEDEDGLKLAGSVAKDQAKKVKATFNIPQGISSSGDDFYESFSFLINGERKDIDILDAVKKGSGTDTEYEVSVDVPDYSSANKLTIQAFGKSVVGQEHTSIACIRELSITQQQAPSCSALDITIEKDDTGTTRVKEMTIEASGLGDVTEIVAKFTIGSSNTVVTTNDISSNYLDGTILLDEEFLYNSANFTGSDSFAILDTETNKIDVAVELTVNGDSINSAACVTSERIESSEENEEGVGGGNNEEEEEEEEEEEVGSGNTTTSNFTVKKESSRQCVARTSPQNLLTYTITVNNADTDAEIISSIVDKLPLGFKYVTSSTTINNTAIADENLVQISTVGQAQQITWATQNGWSLNAGQNMVITYKAEVESSALNGQALNEVVVIPANTPATPSSVRTEVSIQVAQSCTAPETSVFDSTIAKIVAGALIVLFGAAFYASSTGYSVSKKLAGSPVTQGVYRAAQMFNWKITNPRKFFEEKSISKIEKKRRSNRR